MPNQWIPISQAPKDGTVMLYGAKGRYRVVTGRWNERFRQWQSEPGAWAIYPTHFMFLPEPPNIEG